MSRTTYKELEGKIESTLQFLRDELKKIKSGRANPSIVEDILVEAYGDMQPIKNVATISVADPQLLTVQPWDKSLVEPISKGIQEANIGINPAVSGDLIRLPLPQLTEERRVEYVKLMKEKLEEARIAVRAVRKDVLVGLQNKEKDGDMGEDDLNRMEKHVQNVVDKANEEIEEIGTHKEEELMKV
ncbi:ribosome recycling factor [Candidatus Dojkabacteria bacterium]|uniref:Ribosome-recycling factor n=1 Tax=Candidatus Dojkabacteria bacterium TaxID=2099670 RepID=A0A955RKZ7_9BACT|nr:ribosome recycling factor [Candidatus Dojkabacteria bacterium]